MYIDILALGSQLIRLLVATGLEVAHEVGVILDELVIQAELDRSLIALTALVLEFVLDEGEELVGRRKAEYSCAPALEATDQLALTATLVADHLDERGGELL